MDYNPGAPPSDPSLSHQMPREHGQEKLDHKCNDNRPTAGISVIIPNHNHAEFLPAAVASVRAQGRADLEIIVVDDGSTDDTDRVLRDVAGDDLRSFRQPRAGAAAARNRGIRESGGEWIAFLDTDDYWLPGKLGAQMRALEDGAGDCAFAYCGWMLVDEKGDPLIGEKGNPRGVRRAAPGESRLEELVWGNQIFPSTVVVRKEALYNAGLFDESLDTIGEDWDLWLRLTARGYRGVCVSGPLVARRVSSFHGKYKVRNFEAATVRTISRLFKSVTGRPDLAHLVRRKNRVISWHQSVLAKNYLECGELLGFLRCSLRCVWAHPILGWYYLAPGRILGVRFKGTPGYDGR